MARRKHRHKRRPRRGSCDDPGRQDRLRWRRQARELIAAFEPETAGDEKLRRLLISLADFLEPGPCQRLGAEGVWGVFRAFREIAEEGCVPSSERPATSDCGPLGNPNIFADGFESGDTSSWS